MTPQSRNPQSDPPQSSIRNPQSDPPQSSIRNPQSTRLLVVEDSERDAKLLVRALRRGGFTVEWERVGCEADMRAALEGETWDLVICDYRIPGFGALEALDLYRQLGLDLPFLVVSGAVGEDAAVECMRHGAHDYLMKDRLTRLCEAVRRELREAESRRHKREYEHDLKESTRRLTTLMDNLPGMAYRCTNEQGWPMEFVSEGCLPLTGYSPEELLAGDPLSFADLIHPDDRQKVWDCVQEAISNNARFVVEYRLVKTRNDTRWVWEQGQAVALDGRGIIVLEGFITDITERKRAEQRLESALGELRSLHERVSAENVYLREEVRLGHLHGDIVGVSDAMRSVLAEAEQVAKTDTTVVILGETGTGKELLARAIHNMSDREGRPFVALNCAAIPATLVESELFGHEKGSFTGALKRQIGRFEAADTGTIFLDEIGDLPPEAQAKLLRVLEEGKVERLGSAESIGVDVRILAATNRDLEADIEAGRFRQDLFFRLNVFPITIPPLRERVDDIEPLVWAFANEFSARMGRRVDGISRSDLDRLRSYPWPGNVRELRNVVERAMITTRGDVLKIQLPQASSPAGPSVAAGSLDEVQRRHILAVLAKTRWRIRGTGGAAEILGLKPTTLEARMAKLGIVRPPPK